jgi:lipid II:glycine glycyltransferase (peptidoglycan interpeptide bridge formation enzyme)
MGLSSRARWKYLEIRGGMPFFKGARPSVSFLGHSLDLRRTEEDLFNAFDSSTRRAVRKAEESGLTISFSREPEAVRSFHRLLCKTRRRHGVPPQPIAFFENIHEQVISRNQGWIVLATVGHEPIAGAVFFEFERGALFKFGASDQKFQRLRANNLVMWSAIKHYCNRGFHHLDFGRTSITNVGLQNFKLGWGAKERTIDYVRQDCRTGRFVVARDAASGFSSWAFGLLPDPLFKWAGSVLYRHVA